MIAKFNAATGNNVPLNPNQAPSRADEIRALGKTSTPAQEPGFLSRTASDLSNRGKSIQKDFNESFSKGKNPISTTIQNAQGALRIAGDVAGGINDVVGQGIKSIAPGLPDIISKVIDTTTTDKSGKNVLQRYQDWSAQHPDAAKNLNSVFNIGTAATTVGGGVEGATRIAEAAPQISKDLAQTGSDIASKAKSTVSGIKENISPSLTPEEQVGHIIQGKIGDIPTAQRTFNALPSDTGDITKMTPKELSDTVDKHIQSNLEKVDTHFANDTTPHKLSSFEKTTGKGVNAVKTNYVQQAIDQLKEFYTKTNDATGLSDIKALEERANNVGLTSHDLNNLAKEHGSAINAFNVNGEAASGLTKQAAENTRSGVKATARDTLAKTNPEAAKEATQLDRETADAIKTKKLLDKQVEKENTSVQKNGKPSKLSKTIKAIKDNPIKSAAATYVVDKTLKKATGIGF